MSGEYERKRKRLRPFLIVAIAVYCLLGFLAVYMHHVGLLVILLFGGIIVLAPAVLLFSYYTDKAQTVIIREGEQEIIKDVVEEYRSEEVLGCIRVNRMTASLPSPSITRAVLIITPIKLFVETLYGETIDGTHDKLAIPKSEITRIELSKRPKFFTGVNLNIITREKEYRWWAIGLVPEKKGVKLEDYENILRQAFPDKLSVKK